jgi:hypothetical protein
MTKKTVKKAVVKKMNAGDFNPPAEARNMAADGLNYVFDEMPPINGAVVVGKKTITQYNKTTKTDEERIILQIDYEGVTYNVWECHALSSLIAEAKVGGKVWIKFEGQTKKGKKKYNNFSAYYVPPKK